MPGEARRFAMRFANRKIAFVVALTVVASASWLIGADKRKLSNKNAAVQMPESQRALHALNRLTFGPRPGEAERVAQTGVDKWIEQQLHPEKIDDAALQARVAGFRTLRMSAREMVQTFPPPQMLKRLANGRGGLPSDPEKRAVYESALQRYEQKRQNKVETKDNKNPAEPRAVASDESMADDAATAERRRERRQERLQAESQADSIANLAPDARYSAILKMDPDERRVLIARLPPEQRQRIFADLTPQQRETLQATINPQAVVVNELQ